MPATDSLFSNSFHNHSTAAATTLTTTTTTLMYDDSSTTFDVTPPVTNATTAGSVDCIVERFKEDIVVPTHFSPGYIGVEVAIAALAVLFNAVIVHLYARHAYIRRSAANAYIISLASADFLVGLLGIPAAILTSIGLPENFGLCLVSTSILLQICTTSIFSLVAVTIDRYLAILRPLRYQTLMSRRKVSIIISLCWIAGFFVGFVPLMGCNRGAPPKPRCFFLEVNNLGYLVFLFFSTIVFPSLFMACVYFRIHKEIIRQLRKSAKMSSNRALISKLSSERSSNIGKNSTSPTTSAATTSVQVNNTSLCLVSSWRAEVKVFRSLVLVVTAFMVSWAPLYALNTFLYFRPCTLIPEQVFNVFICLSHLNSVWNPLIYAFGTKDFKKALFRLRENATSRKL